MKKRKLEHPPAFQFYANDFSSSATVEAMSTTAVGAYVLLLCKAWYQDPVGTIPDNDDILSKWSRVSRREWMKIREYVLSAFILIDGRWHQKRMQDEWKSLLERRKERSQSGSKGGKSAAKERNNRKQIGSSATSEVIANDSSSSSTSASSSTSVPKTDSGGPEAGPAQPNPDDEAVLTFPVQGKPFTWNLTRGKLREFQESFPALDVLRECRQALQWVKENRAKQKTFRGMGAFLLNWLSRSQNSGRGRDPGPGGSRGLAPAGGGNTDPRGNHAARDEFLRQNGIDPDADSSEQGAA